MVADEEAEGEDAAKTSKEDDVKKESKETSENVKGDDAKKESKATSENVKGDELKSDTAADPSQDQPALITPDTQEPVQRELSIAIPSSSAGDEVKKEESKAPDQKLPKTRMKSKRSMSIMQDRKETIATDAEARSSYMKACQDTFAKYDTDKSGAIDADELYDALTSQGVMLSPKNVRTLIAEVDEDESGEIEFSEFVALLEKIGPPPENFENASLMQEGSADMAAMIGDKMPKLMKVDTFEERSIVENTAAVCRRLHGLKKMNLVDLENVPFFFGGGGFSCAGCKVSSHNLVSRECYFCEECEFTLCSACAESRKKSQIDAEISRRIDSRRKDMFKTDEAQSPKSVRHKKEGKCFQRQASVAMI